VVVGGWLVVGILDRRERRLDSFVARDLLSACCEGDIKIDADKDDLVL
jgi:hypothetical protein